MLKHDFTTFDCFGRWGFQMRDGVTADGWSFADTARTSAEIIRDLYAAIRAAAGEALIIGCNTMGHLSAGLHEVQRTGDDKVFTPMEMVGGPSTRRLKIGLQIKTFQGKDPDSEVATEAAAWGEVPPARQIAMIPSAARSPPSIVGIIPIAARAAPGCSR